ncbi:response regulator transcription factor [Hyphomicrobium sp. NDB2Meth4]|uniref:response regulator transcription factor n=1 Tax=Hyphomicrobium sp. NDB2Meth4 TaxID=1892846 RepID=UPI0009305742|nr:response regulator transcription factor [Hyphomicrobium sp. NDB2Meth4]
MSDEQAVVYVIDDDESIREALRSLLATVGLDVRTFATTRDFLEAKRPDAASCLVLDVRLPGVSGLDFQGELTRSGIAFPIIFISGHGDIPMTVRAIKAGAIEFLTKPFREQELLDAVQAGIQQDRERRENAAGMVGLQERLGSLTAREREVMALVVTGLMNKQIAGQLNLSEITVKVHRGNVMHKMRAKSLAELVRMADKLGLSPAPKA